MPELVPLDKLKEMIGQEIGVSEWITIDQPKINAFADCTGDHQWIHVNVEMAKKGPFGGPIAHGYLTLSLMPLFSSSLKYLPAGIKMAVNYGLNKVRFINPLPVDSRIRSKAVLTNIEEKGGGKILMTVTHTVEIDGKDKPACVAETLSMFFT